MIACHISGHCRVSGRLVIIVPMSGLRVLSGLRALSGHRVGTHWAKIARRERATVGEDSRKSYPFYLWCGEIEYLAFTTFYLSRSRARNLIIKDCAISSARQRKTAADASENSS